jgi:RNA polymerase sigma factor (sigma-70 family)
VNDDSTLLRRYAEDRSNAAFTELVGRHLDFVFSAAMREVRGDFARAQDVTQNVFTALARKASFLHQRTTLVGWLHISVHHAAAELMRSEQRRQKREKEASAMLQQSSPSAPEADWERLKPVLNEVVQELGDVERDAVLLRFYQRRPLAEIGALLRLSEAATQKRVERALEKMRTSLVRRGITSTSAALAAMLQSNTVAAAPIGLLGTITQGALASASAGSGAAAFFQLISFGKIPLGIAASLVLVGGGAIAMQKHANAELRKGISTLQPGNQSVALPRAQSDEAKSKLEAPRAIEAEGNRAPSERLASAAVSAKKAQNPDGAPAFTANQVKQWLAAANDPKVLARLASDGRAVIQLRYSPFIDQLSLTAVTGIDYVE